MKHVQRYRKANLIVGSSTSMSVSRSEADTSIVRYVFLSVSFCFVTSSHTLVNFVCSRFLCAGRYALYRQALPAEMIMISTFCSSERWSTNCFNVPSGMFTTTLSQDVKPSGFALTGPWMMGSKSLLTVFAGGMGSERSQRGRARFTKPFLNSSNFLDFSVTTLRSSAVTSPITMAVVVAIAGMIFPAIIFTLCFSASGIL
mmetsp:Transcript_1654/g.4486  ORF Transcript_1654/g.4486 Transcript_1654/m.4486 type:complete len:201 (-) Transcript_1654:2572-3174(-)